MTFVLIIFIMVSVFLSLDFHYVYIFGQILVHEYLFDIIIVELDLCLGQVMTEFSVHFIFIHVVIIELWTFIIFQEEDWQLEQLKFKNNVPEQKLMLVLKRITCKYFTSIIVDYIF